MGVKRGADLSLRASLHLTLTHPSSSKPFCLFVWTKWFRLVALLNIPPSNRNYHILRILPDIWEVHPLAKKRLWNCRKHGLCPIGVGWRITSSHSHINNWLRPKLCLAMKLPFMLRPQESDQCPHFKPHPRSHHQGNQWAQTDRNIWTAPRAPSYVLMFLLKISTWPGQLCGSQSNQAIPIQPIVITPKSKRYSKIHQESTQSRNKWG